MVAGENKVPQPKNSYRPSRRATSGNSHCGTIREIGLSKDAAKKLLEKWWPSPHSPKMLTREGRRCKSHDRHDLCIGWSDDSNIIRLETFLDSIPPFDFSRADFRNKLEP